jgi:hypothetical protein
MLSSVNSYSGPCIVESFAGLVRVLHSCELQLGTNPRQHTLQHAVLVLNRA